MNEIKEIIIESFYTQPLMILSAVLAIILGIIHRKKFQMSWLLILYPGASLLQSFIAYYSFTTDSLIEIDTISANLFILIEFLILYNFFNSVIIINSLKKYIRLIFPILLVYISIMWIFTNTFREHPIRLFLLESLCILSFCFIYLFQLFKLPPKVNLLNDAAFWITIGCLFYFSCTIPLFLIDSVLSSFPRYHNYYSFYSINYLAYSILFLFISKAFLCNPDKTK